MYGNPPFYTWAGLPKYKMAGCQMCSGENSVPTWPFHCFDRSILTIDRSPELTAVSPRPSVKNTPDGSILESRAPTTPVALRPISARHAPAVVSPPGVQFRKDCWHPQKPSFGRWLRKRQRFFRNWAPGSGKVSGAWSTDSGRNLTGQVDYLLGTTSGGITSGCFSRTTQRPPVAVAEGQNHHQIVLNFDAATVWGEHAGAEFVPPHVWQPAILYLGLAAQV